METIDQTTDQGAEVANPDIENQKAVIAHTLTQLADQLSDACGDASRIRAALRDGVVEARTAGVLTVAQIAAAIGRDRNAVDAIWSASGRTVKGKQTRTVIAEHYETDVARATEELTRLASTHRDATAQVESIREVRDIAVVAAYKGKLFGPSAIASMVRVDRNHVLRLVRKAGVAPAYRANPKNQHTAKRDQAGE